VLISTKISTNDISGNQYYCLHMVALEHLLIRLVLIQKTTSVKSFFKISTDLLEGLLTFHLSLQFFDISNKISS
jgi:hypothetical protein